MRKHTILSLGLAICIYTLSFSQNLTPFPCTHDHWLQSMQVHSPQSFNAIDEIYTDAIEYVRSVSSRNNDPLYVIPVVVHNVWRLEGDIINEETARNQIDQLNTDFSLDANQSGLLRREFEDISALPRIQFELVHFNQVKTDSVFRLEIDWNNFSLKYPDIIKSSATGGSDAWDSQRYLNIWTCGVYEDQFLGYSYPPTDFNLWPEHLQAPSPAVDGIVINNKVFGKEPKYLTSMGSIIYTSIGRTLSHEVGHYLGLRHPWGIEDLSLNPCEADDGLKDTPLVAGAHPLVCNGQINSCIETPNDLPDMFENFMDYSMESCRSTFTKDQVSLMHYVLDKYRPQLRQKSISIGQRVPLKVYPNPSRGTVQVFANPEFSEEYEISIVGTDSREIDLPARYYPTSQFAQYQVDLSGLPNGVYFVQLKSSVRRLSKKIVLMR